VHCHHTDSLWQLNLVNSYVLDPSHIAPSRSDANSNGHFPLPNNHHMSSGTPRGFNLQNMNMMNLGQNGMVGINGMQPTFQNGQAFVPGLPNPFAMGDMGGTHNPGALRRGGRFNNNRSGPYDRNNRGNMQRGYSGGSMGGMGMRMPSGSIGGGMGMGFVAQGGGGGGGKWGDGAAGGTGPREAVQGRSIKSYEDLDAQPASGGNAGGGGGGAGGAELDY
jgi:hypothetical protein